MSEGIRVVHYWGGSVEAPSSRFSWHVEVLRRCRERGWQTWIVFSRRPENKEMSDVLKDAGIGVVESPRPPRNFDVGCMYRSWRIFRRLRCDIAHVHCVHTSPMIGAAAASVPVRVWSMRSTSDYQIKGITAKGIHSFSPSVRATSALAHLILPVSESLKSELMALGVPDSKMSLAPTPVDLARFQIQRQSALARELGLTKDDIVIVSVGQASYGKAWDVLIRSFAKVVKAAPTARLLLVGGLDRKERQRQFAPRLKRLAEEMNVARRVQFLDVRSDIPELLSISDVFAFPTRGEGLPGALLEAMAAGLPCVATRIGGNVELIRHNENGLLVDVNDVENLAISLARLVDDRYLAHRLGQAARGSLVPFSLDHQVEHVMGLYDGQLYRISRLRERRPPRVGAMNTQNET